MASFLFWGCFLCFGGLVLGEGVGRQFDGLGYVG
jgi:hypothetical protein